MPHQDLQQTDRSFSIELTSKNQVKNISLADENNQKSTLIEGTIGSFVEASFVDDIVLEVRGTNGVLRIDLLEKELETVSVKIRKMVT